MSHAFDERDRSTPGAPEPTTVDEPREAPGATTAPAPEWSRPVSRRSSASLQVNVGDGLSVQCPRCGTTSASHDLSLNLSLGPVAEGSHLFLVTAESKLEEVVDRVRRTMVTAALDRAGGNIARAAESLGVKYTTLYSIVQRLGIDLGRKSRRRRRQAPLEAVPADREQIA